ncbi:MAG: LysR family transcriptional regulator [Bacteroides sp.]|nr:LysR family transcriptional regulator [Eubacterium sp.]MCM1418035.1 LysR family transcriptional regulator [Roseburia sp.]MCM1462142.1 LysR family transcriptional regulator [Bacteroides sp.]
MTLQQLGYAIAVAEEGSISRAAARLYIAQPSLTAAIAALERETAIRLFVRTNRGVVPTAEGEDFLAYARQVCQQYDLLLDRFGGKKRRRRFAVSTQHYSFAIKAFVDTVKKYDTLDFDFAIRETRTDTVIRDVGSLRSEIGILFLSDLNRKVLTRLFAEQELTFHPLAECKAYVYLWKNHPLARESSIRFERLRDYPCLSFEQGERSSLFLAEEILAENDYPRVIRTEDRATMLDLMIGLNGYTLCSGIICEELSGSDFCTVPFEDDETNRNSVMEIGYLTKKHGALSDIGETYITAVRQTLAMAQKSLEASPPQIVE